MYPKIFIIVVGYLLSYPFIKSIHETKEFYYSMLSLFIIGYTYCLCIYLYKLQRSSPIHQFQDEEEQKIAAELKKSHGKSY